MSVPVSPASPMPATPTPTTTGVVSGQNAVKTPSRNITDIASLVPQYDAEYIQQILFENL
jgi:hypothetical protein